MGIIVGNIYINDSDIFQTCHLLLSTGKCILYFTNITAITTAIKVAVSGYKKRWINS